MMADIKRGWSVHIEFQPKSVPELKEACEYVRTLQAPLSHEEGVAPPREEPRRGNGDEQITYDRMMELYHLAKNRNVYLKNLTSNLYGKKPGALTVDEALGVQLEIERR